MKQILVLLIILTKPQIKFAIDVAEFYEEKTKESLASLYTTQAMRDMYIEQLAKVQSLLLALRNELIKAP